MRVFYLKVGPVGEILNNCKNAGIDAAADGEHSSITFPWWILCSAATTILRLFTDASIDCSTLRDAADHPGRRPGS